MSLPSTTLRSPSFVDLFTPKLVTVLREGYTVANLRADALAGLTVAIVALPLSMAIAIGSGLSPEKGLFTAIVGGFLISAMGGSRFQVGGPAGAFIVLIATIMERRGYEGLVLSTMMAGAIMIVVGYLRLGTYIKYIPFPVTVGFTAGIAVIILMSQVKDLLGLDIAHEPAALIPKLAALAQAIVSVKPATVALSALAIGLILGLRRWRPKWPGLLVAVGITTALASILHLDVATIGSRFGAMPSGLPQPTLPLFSLEGLRAALPDAISIALLGAIESLLSAVVADAMSGRRHRSNCELVAQGAANIAAVIFGGMCVTGTIARTATNVRSGAHGPLSGIFHALYILLFLGVAGPLAGFIPLASLSSVLMVVAWNMADKRDFWALLRTSWGDATVLLATFLLTIFNDLSVAIGVGVTLSAFLFLHQMAENVEVAAGVASSGDDLADEVGADKPAYRPLAGANDVLVYRISGAFFFGAASTVGAVFDQIAMRPKVFVLDFSSVPFIDISGLRTLEPLVEKLHRDGTKVVFAGANKTVLRALIAAGFRRPKVRYARDAATAAGRAGRGDPSLAQASRPAEA